MKNKVPSRSKPLPLSSKPKTDDCGCAAAVVFAVLVAIVVIIYMLWPNGLPTEGACYAHRANNSYEQTWAKIGTVREYDGSIKYTATSTPGMLSMWDDQGRAESDRSRYKEDFSEIYSGKADCVYYDLQKTKNELRLLRMEREAKK